MLSKMPLNYQRSRFTWRNCGCERSLYGCSLEVTSPLEESREAMREQHATEDASVRGGEREEEFSSLHSIDISNFC